MHFYKYFKTLCILVSLTVILLSCSAGGGSTMGSSGPVTTHSVTLTWAANRESGVNSAGGGYQVSISGKPAINVPYVSGSSAPTTTAVLLNTGTYSVTVRAYAALDAQGGSNGRFSAASSPITVIVP